MAVINFRDARPIFEQVADHYKQLILAGVLEPGERLPSVRSLAMVLSTNPNTIQKAYAELERSGYCYSVQGKGNFVSDETEELKQGKRDELIERLADLREEALETGIDPDALWKEASERRHK